MDILTPAQRHFNMSRIHGKDTKPELIVRKWLWNHGFRFRLYRKDLPGKPDIVLPKYKAIIFIHGCFWHRHDCKYTSTPKTNQEFWNKKLNRNVERDKNNIKTLEESGWRVLVIWACEIKNWNIELENKILKFIENREDSYLDYNSDYLIAAETTGAEYDKRTTYPVAEI